MNKRLSELTRPGAVWLAASSAAKAEHLPPHLTREVQRRGLLCVRSGASAARAISLAIQYAHWLAGGQGVRP